MCSEILKTEKEYFTNETETKKKKKKPNRNSRAEALNNEMKNALEDTGNREVHMGKSISELNGR